MKVAIASGSVQNGAKYTVNGTGTVTYNAVSYSVGQTFVGVVSVNTFTTTGSPLVYQLLEISGVTLEEIIRADDIEYPVHLKIQSLVIEEVLPVVYSDEVTVMGVTIEEIMNVGGGIIWFV